MATTPTSNIHVQTLDVTTAARAALMGQRPACLWLTGLSGAGKTTVANELDRRLHANHLRTFVLDGDNVRHGLCQDLGFSHADRVENMRRVTEVARLMVDAGLIVIVAFISPFRAERDLARSRFRPGEFFEIYLDTPLGECERRDPKGLYAKARRGEITQFTGIDSPYEPPLDASLKVDTSNVSAQKAVDMILGMLAAHGIYADSARNV